MMKKEKVILDFGEGKKVFVDARICSNPFSQARGLMFRRAEKSPVLVFRFNRDVKEPIHSFFVFQDFVAVWLDSENKVLEARKIKTFLPYVSLGKKFRTLVEIPISAKNKKILDDIEKFK